LIGLWLIYKAVIEAPVLIEVEFDSGEGIEVGKTVVRYEGIETNRTTDNQSDHHYFLEYAQS